MVVGLTGLAALAVGGVAWLDQRGRSAVLHDTATALAARRAASEIARFLQHAQATVSLGPEPVARGALHRVQHRGPQAPVRVLRLRPQPPR